jgi:3-isopropylmalate/(R)-2-methylmalate dehydratase small subunit
MFEYSGKAICFGDDINTDYIISSRRKKDTINPDELIPYIMEDIRPGLAGEINKNSLIVAGENFGCGSAMEVAVQVLKSAGIQVILAKSFARSYYRNSVNNGILPIEMDTSNIQEGDIVQVSMDDNRILVTDNRTNMVTSCPAFNGKIKEILSIGGIVPYIRQKESKCRNSEDE